MTERYASVAWDPESHDARAFDSGVIDIDEWLRSQAAIASRRGLSRTFVWVESSAIVRAYYTLAAHKVSRDSLPPVSARGMPREIPAILVAKVALDRSLHGQGIGAALVADALRRGAFAARTVGARLAVVDPSTDDLVGFYARLGFSRIPGSRRMIQRIKDLPDPR
ncbi:MAG: GNAT family N-acetyltransferase [Actinomycetota bacterium]